MFRVARSVFQSEVLLRKSIPENAGGGLLRRKKRGRGRTRFRMKRSLGIWGRRLGVLTLLGAVMLTGCRMRSRTPGDVQVRFINAVPDAGGLNVSVDRRQIWKRAAFRSNTGYQEFEAGTYPVRVDSASPQTTVLSKSLTLEKGHQYTVLALGRLHGGGSVQVQTLEDKPSEDLPARKASVRLINAAPGQASLDLVVNNIVAVDAVAFGKRSAPLRLDSGDYDLQVAASGAPDMVAGPIHLPLKPGRAYTLVVMSSGAGGPLSLDVYPDAPPK